MNWGIIIDGLNLALSWQVKLRSTIKVKTFILEQGLLKGFRFCNLISALFAKCAQCR